MIQDADLEYNPMELRNLLIPLKNNEADIGRGSRFLSTGAHWVLYFWHYIGNRFLTFISNYVYGPKSNGYGNLLQSITLSFYWRTLILSCFVMILRFLFMLRLTKFSILPALLHPFIIRTTRRRPRRSMFMAQSICSDWPRDCKQRFPKLPLRRSTEILRLIHSLRPIWGA